jgi:hypothetical protein
MLFNPIIAMLHNSGANRWHPIVFVESPLPGPHTPDKPIRHKSKMHHTGGFATREEAEANAKDDLAPKIEGPRLELATVFEWDGEGIPTMVHFFG